MATLREWFTRLWGTLRPGRRDAELEAELRLHLELATEDERRRANSREGAVRAAAIRSGGMAQAMEAVRDQRGLPWLDDLARDLRYGLRALRRNPMFASVAVLTLALGIGANTAIFSLADAVLLRTLPVSNPRDLVMLRQRGPGGDIFPFTSAAAADLAPDRDVLSGLAAFRPLLSTHVGVKGETELALAQLVSGNYHAVLGIHAVLGRTLTEQDRDPVAVISHGYWQRRFASDPNVVGAHSGDAGAFLHDRWRHASRVLRDTAGSPRRRHGAACRTDDEDAAERPMALPGRAPRAGRVPRAGADGVARPMGATRRRSVGAIAYSRDSRA